MGKKRRRLNVQWQKVFHAATGNKRCATVDRRKGGTWSSCTQWTIKNVTFYFWL